MKTKKVNWNQSMSERARSKAQSKYGGSRHSCLTEQFDAFIEGFKEASKDGVWIKSSKKLPPKNVSVLCFIPEEDDHITTGMYDVSEKWVLLDEYRVPKSEVTYWRVMVDLPNDKEYNKTHRAEDDETTTDTIRNLQMKVFELERILREVIPS